MYEIIKVKFKSKIKIKLIIKLSYFQGQAVAQLCKTVDVTVFGVASKTKHEALKGTIDHLLERGSDYATEVRK